jgi:flagellar hook-length control protein FliK
VRTALPAGLETIQLAPLQGQPGSMDWSSQLGNRIRWMSNLNLSSAELKLYQAELGTLEILISAEDDQARVNFITSNATTRELIENSLPRLRELLGQSGLLLEQGDVSQRDLNRQSNRESAAITGEAPPSVPESDAANPGQVPLYQPGGAYQVDQYA